MVWNLSFCSRIFGRVSPERLVLSTGSTSCVLECGAPTTIFITRLLRGVVNTFTRVWCHPSTSTSCFSYLDYYISIDIPVLKIRPPGIRYAHQALFTIKLLLLKVHLFSHILFIFGSTHRI